MGLDTIRGSRLTLQEMVYRDLKAAIMSGIFPEGRQLTVKEIVETTSTSAMPVREAIRRLVAEHGLETRPNGTVAILSLTMRERAIVHASRISLETMAARLAAEVADTEAIRELTRINREYEEAVEDKNWTLAVRKNREFHFRLYMMCGSTILMSQIESLWLANGPYVATHVHNLIANSWGPERAEHHRAILAGLEAKSPHDVAKALRVDISAIEEIENALRDLMHGEAPNISLAAQPMT